MNQLFLEIEAEEELELAASRYEDAVPGLGVAFLAEMRQRLRDIVEAPLSGPVFGEADVRCAHALGRFPHTVSTWWRGS